MRPAYARRVASRSTRIRHGPNCNSTIPIITSIVLAGCLDAIKFLDDGPSLLSAGFDQLVQVQPLLTEGLADPIQCPGSNNFLRGDQHPVGCLSHGDEISLF